AFPTRRGLWISPLGCEAAPLASPYWWHIHNNTRQAQGQPLGRENWCQSSGEMEKQLIGATADLIRKQTTPTLIHKLMQVITGNAAFFFLFYPFLYAFTPLQR